MGRVGLRKSPGISEDARKEAGFQLGKVQAGLEPSDWKTFDIVGSGTLGFAPEEAKRLQAASRKQINDTRLLKQQLMEELSSWIRAHHLKQADAAEILMVSRPRVSDVVNRKTAKFTIDTLVEMLSRIGKPLRLAAS